MACSARFSAFFLYASTFYLCLVLSPSSTAGHPIPNSTLPMPSASPSPISIPVYHIKKFAKLQFKDSDSYALARLASDKERFQHFTMVYREYELRSGQSPLYATTPVFSKFSGEHVVELRIGARKMRTQLLLDTGSPLIWWQCLPCIKCYAQKNLPYYNPFEFTSFEFVKCPSEQCDQNQAYIEDFCTMEEQCPYRIRYGDGDNSRGKLATEILSSKDGMFSYNVIFGCGSQNVGTYFNGSYAGILGFQNHKHSFPNQIRASKFSFCLVKYDEDISENDPDQSAPLYLYEFPSIKYDSFVVSLQSHPMAGFNTYYYVEFKGISIHDEMLPISEDKWKISSNGRHGVILDTGTTLTRFPEEVYTMFRNKFVREADYNPLPLNASYEPADTCYKISRHQSLGGFPSVSLHFDDEKVLHLDTNQILIPAGSRVYCLAFAPSEIPHTILGSLQLQTTRLSFDLLEHTVTFSKWDC